MNQFAFIKEIIMKSMTRILMVYPKIPTTYWSLEYAIAFVNQKSSMPPLGLMTIAAMLPSHYDVKLVDLNLCELKEEDFAGIDLVFLSAMLVQKESFQKVVAAAKKQGIPVAAGGPYPTNSYKEIEGVDYFILNEGEITLPKFLRDFENGRPKAIYEDLTKPDLSSSPIPRFDLIQTKDYSAMALQLSRGCPFNCEFCDIIEMFGRTPRYKEPEQFLRELDAVLDAGYIGPLFIVDDNFIGHRKKVKDLLRKIIQWQELHNYPFTLFTEASINLAEDEELLNLMVVAGFDMVFVGLESPDESILQQTQKKQNVNHDMITSVDRIQRSGIEVMAGFILGFDNESEDIFDRQIEFIDRSAIPMSMIGLMMALPNTQLYRRLQKENRLLSTSNGNNTHQLSLNFIPTMDTGILVKGYKRVLSTIYQPENYFRRAFAMIEKFPKRVYSIHSERSLTRDVPALLRSVAKQGFSDYALHYWKFLFKVLLRRPYHFGFAVTQAIKGYHNFRITKEIFILDEFLQQVSSLNKNLEQISDAENATKSVSSFFRTRKKLRKRFHGFNTNMQFYVQAEWLDLEDKFSAVAGR